MTMTILWNPSRTRLLVVCSFTNELVRFEMPENYPLESGTLVLANYEHNFVIANGFTTRPPPYSRS